MLIYINIRVKERERQRELGIWQLFLRFNIKIEKN